MYRNNYNVSVRLKLNIHAVVSSRKSLFLKYGRMYVTAEYRTVT